MDIQDFGAIGDIVGGVAVVFTLIFLAFELRRNTRSVRASTSYEAQNSIALVNEAASRDPELLKLLTRSNVIEVDCTKQTMRRSDARLLKMRDRTMESQRVAL